MEHRRRAPSPPVRENLEDGTGQSCQLQSAEMGVRGRELVGEEDAVEPTHPAAVYEELVVAAAAAAEEPTLQILVETGGS